MPEKKKKSKNVDVQNLSFFAGIFNLHYFLFFMPIAAEVFSGFSNKQEDEMEDEQAGMHLESARPLKRLRLRGQESQSMHPLTNSGPSSAASPLKKPKLETDVLPGSSSRQRPQNIGVSSDENARIEACPVPPQDGIVEKGKQPVSPQVAPRRGRLISESASPSVPSKDPTVDPRMRPLPNSIVPHSHALIIPKDEPIDELPDYEVPIAVIPPGI